MPTPEHPEKGGRYYLVDDAHVPAELVEAVGDPYGVFTPPAPAAPAADSADPSTEEEI